MNIASWSEENLQCFGDYEAVVAGDRIWRSADLHAQACRLASALVAAGMAPGDRVLLLLPNGAELIVAFTATVMAGGVAVPMFAGTTTHELQRVSAQCTPIAVVVGDGVLATAAAPARAASLRIGAPGRTTYPGWESFEAIIESTAALASPVPREDAESALICFTSGTSSTPKGVIFTHAGIRARHPRANRRPQGARGPTTVLAALPLGTMGAMMLTGRLTAKTLLVLHDGFEPCRFVDAIERHRIQALALVPSMAEAILALPDVGQRDLGSLRNVTLGGSHVAPELLERLAAILPVPPTVSYGMTEAGGGISTALFRRRHDGGTSVSTGAAMASVDVKIRDEHGSEVGRDQIGEVYVRTPWLSAGYYGQPELTAELFQDGWLRTGDLGYLDSRGELHIAGRRKDVIIQAGVNVHPSEVEAAIRRLPGIAACAVIGVPNAFLGEEVVACVVPAAGAPISSDAVIVGCREQLDPRKVPVRAVLLSALPTTPAGKIDSAELRRQVLADTTGAGTTLFAELQESTRERRTSRIGELIAVQVCSLQSTVDLASMTDREYPDRTFEELGLDSLQLVRLSHRIGEALGRPVSPLLAFSNGTVAALAARLATDLFGDAPLRPLVRGDRPPRSPIAIVGVGCRMPPGSDGPEALWTLLDASGDATSDIQRWALARPGGGRTGAAASATTRAALLEDVGGFDATFFGMSHREAAGIDPQHRMALEVTWHALEHAGWNPLSMRGTQTGVFLGMSGSGDASLEGLGAAPSMATGRICHFLDLHGPAAVVDTACSSSLFAIHAAVQSLRAGECDVAIAGGVSIIGSPRSFVGLSQLGTLAPDGRCKPFDARADGYGRGEGCVLFVLKPLEEAEAQGDRVLAVIRGTAAVHDGRSTSLAAPNGHAQEEVIRRALGDAGVERSSVEYLEAHGTGTPIGDPIELGAAVAVLGHPARRLVVGSIKSNVGHLEAAAGAAGLLKVVLALQHERIPAHLHLQQLNPLLEPLASQIVIPTTSHPWPARVGQRRIAGVTSMGLSGTNVHLIVEDAARSHVTGANRGVEASPRLLCVSARSEASLDAQIQRFADHLGSVTDASFADSCFTSAVGRAPFTHRAAVVAATPQHASAELHASLHGSSAAVSRGTARAAKVAFLFSGHGTQHAGMGKTLFDQHPVFCAALHRCADILQPLVTPSLLTGLGLDGRARANASPLDDPAFAQPALVSFAWALAELWKSWGVTPAWVAGHSLGECAAACVAGLLSVEDALALAAARGRLLASLTGIGGMVAVRASARHVEGQLHGFHASVAIAAINGPQSTVVSGHQQPLEEIVARLTGDGIETCWLAVPCASHSPVTEPVLDELERVAGTLNYMRPHLPMVSTLTGRVTSFEELSNPQYWRRQMREPVRFADAVATLVESGCDAFVEIGPDPILLAGAQDAVRERPGERVWVATQRRDRDANEQMLTSLGELFVSGIEPAWSGVYADAARRRVVLPTYAFDHRRPPREAVTTTDAAPAAEHRRSERLAVDPPPTGTGFRQRVLAAAPAERHSLLQEWIRREFALCTGAALSDVALDCSCLELGLDSLRITDLATRIHRALGIACTPAEVVSHPTPEALSRRLGAALPAHQPDDAVEAHVAPPRDERPVVVLHRRGTRPALFCFHPSGGRITAYLRLRALLGDDQPLYAIQSRALTNPGREHPTLAAMAIDYASLVDSTCEPPYALLGWSLGGLIAHAVARELERRGATIGHVTMIDARALDPHRARTFARDRSLALMAWLLETHPRLSADAVRACLRGHDMSGFTPVELVGWCEQQGFVDKGVVAAESLDASLGLYHRHFALAEGYEPRPVTAPIDQWWVEPVPAGNDADKAFGEHVRQHVVTGTHFSVMQSPAIETIVSALVAGATAG
jgi:acyl transferase domain-containing protein/acyl-CoA synthetase (AMP-forming)/AMP-acid ligase II/thioesterase domain-containing protein